MERKDDNKTRSFIRERIVPKKNAKKILFTVLGVIAALECLRVPCEVDVYSDSKYVVSAFNENWVGNWQKNGWKTASRQPVKNKELWDRLLAAMQPHTVHYHWVKGHAGHPENERCDVLATTAADEAGQKGQDTGLR